MNDFSAEIEPVNRQRVFFLPDRDERLPLCFSADGREWQPDPAIAGLMIEDSRPDKSHRKTLLVLYADNDKSDFKAKKPATVDQIIDIVRAFSLVTNKYPFDTVDLSQIYNACKDQIRIYQEQAIRGSQQKYNLKQLHQIEDWIRQCANRRSTIKVLYSMQKRLDQTLAPRESYELQLQKEAQEQELFQIVSVDPRELKEAE